jgi:hypothetical protein
MVAGWYNERLQLQPRSQNSIRTSGGFKGYHEGGTYMATTKAVADIG